jgi:hypothetical protein
VLKDLQVLKVRLVLKEPKVFRALKELRGHKV